MIPRTCISNRPIRRPNPNSPPGGSNGRFPPGAGPGPRGPGPNNRSPPNGRNSPGPGYGPGPQYRPQGGPGPRGPGPMHQGRPMSPAMHQNQNGRNSPGPGGPMYRPQNGPHRGPGPMNQGRPMSPAMGPNGPGPRGPGPAPGYQQGPPRSMTPTGQRRLTPPQGGPGPLAAPVMAAASVPLPESPRAPENPFQDQNHGGNGSRPVSPQSARSIPEVLITPAPPVMPAVQEGRQRSNSVERKPVARKPVGVPSAAPGTAQ
jgi:hypothetical protein